MFCISIPMFIIVEAYGEINVSRRLVNLPYIALQVPFQPISSFIISILNIPRINIIILFR